MQRTHSIGSMIELSRVVRFCVDGRPLPTGASLPQVHNGVAGWPAMSGLGAFYELVVSCRGEPDATTGFLVNIKTIDDAVRRCAIPLIQKAFGEARAQGTDEEDL